MSVGRHRRRQLESAEARFIKSERLQAMPSIDAAKILDVSQSFLSKARIRNDISPPLSAHQRQRIKRLECLAVDSDIDYERKKLRVPILEMAERHNIAVSTLKKFLTLKGFSFLSKCGPQYGSVKTGAFGRIPFTPAELFVMSKMNGWPRLGGMAEHIEMLRRRANG